MTMMKKKWIPPWLVLILLQLWCCKTVGGTRAGAMRTTAEGSGVAEELLQR